MIVRIFPYIYILQDNVLDSSLVNDQRLSSKEVKVTQKTIVIENADIDIVVIVIPVIFGQKYIE